MKVEWNKYCPSGYRLEGNNMIKVDRRRGGCMVGSPACIVHCPYNRETVREKYVECSAVIPSNEDRIKQRMEEVVHDG